MLNFSAICDALGGFLQTNLGKGTIISLWKRLVTHYFVLVEFFFISFNCNASVYRQRGSSHWPFNESTVHIIITPLDRFKLFISSQNGSVLTQTSSRSKWPKRVGHCTRRKSDAVVSRVWMDVVRTQFSNTTIDVGFEFPVGVYFICEVRFLSVSSVCIDSRLHEPGMKVKNIHCNGRH